MEKEKVVVFTLNYNQSKMTLDCAESVLQSNYKNYQLIVIDNGSTKEQYDYLCENCNDSVIIQRIDDNIGYVGGVNFGFIEASKLGADYFLVMNNDTIIDSVAIECLIETAEKYNNDAIISGKVYHFDKPNVIQYTGSFFTDKRYLIEIYPGKNEEDIGQLDTEAERDMIDDIFWLLPSKIYNDIGPYSNNFFLYGEQADYALQASRKGYKLVYTPKAKIWHKGSVTSGDGDRLSPAANFWRNKGGMIYLYRNTKKKYFYFSALKSLVKLCMKNVMNIINLRKNIDKRSEYAALLGTIYGIKWVFNKKPDDGYNPFIR